MRELPTQEVAKAVVARYPELKPYLVPDRMWKRRFHANMFDGEARRGPQTFPDPVRRVRLRPDCGA